MNNSISSAAMSVNSSGPFDTSGPEMGNILKTNRSIKSLAEVYKTLFCIPVNSNPFSKKDYRAAERKFLKYELEKAGLNWRKNYPNNDTCTSQTPTAELRLRSFFSFLCFAITPSFSLSKSGIFFSLCNLKYYDFRSLFN